MILTPSLAGHDGVSAVARAVVRACASDHVELWCLAGGENEERVSRVRYRFANGDRIRFATWAIAGSAARQADTIVLAIHLHLAPVALPLMLRGAALAVFLHGIEAWNPLRGLRRLALRKATWFLAPSHYTFRRFYSSNPAMAGKEARVCAHGIAAEAPATAASAGREPFALIVGRMAADERYKGHDQLLDLWPRLIERVPGAELVIAGDGNDRRRLEMKAETLGIADRVCFLGRVSEETLAGLYRDCAFFVMPSPNEGFGLVFLEAMRAGKASIAAHGAADEILEHGVTGLLVDGAEPEQLLGALHDLFEDPVACERMGRTAASRFLEVFTEAHFQERLRVALGMNAAVLCAESPVS